MLPLIEEIDSLFSDITPAERIGTVREIIILP